MRSWSAGVNSLTGAELAGRSLSITSPLIPLDTLSPGAPRETTSWLLQVAWRATPDGRSAFLVNPLVEIVHNILRDAA